MSNAFQFTINLPAGATYQVRGQCDPSLKERLLECICEAIEEIFNCFKAGSSLKNFQLRLNLNGKFARVWPPLAIN